jgi:dipeptidyl aminopeptidase/acylaminoacyl peptidase
LLVVAAVVSLVLPASAAEPFTIEDAARLRSVTQVAMSPDGEHIAYILSVPRIPFEEDDGGAWTELHVTGREAGSSRGYVTGEVNVSGLGWTPDGKSISFLTKRADDEHRSLYTIPVDGGESRKVYEHGEDITSYSWSPDGSQVAFLSREGADPEKKEMADLGFKAEVYEEGLRNVQVWIASVNDGEVLVEPRVLDLEGSASELHWAPAGNRIAVALAPTSHIDDHYMKRKVHVVDSATGEDLATIANPGKLGAVRWSHDGSKVGMLAAQDPNDPAAGRLLVAPATGGTPSEVLDPASETAVMALAFQEDGDLMFIEHEGVEARLAVLEPNQDTPKELAFGGPILRSVSLSADGMRGAMLADSPMHPGEVFTMSHGDERPVRVTDSNPWLADRALAKQETVTFKARDGLEVQGLLIRPLEESENHPLIMVVHGGPESHYSNGWLTRYSSPGQYAAGEGYALFYVNYRSSTGRGVAYSKLGQVDVAVGEFNDLVDGVKHLVSTGLVDEKRVGITGGSYGGYASAWAATALSEHFAASVMSVGITELISKFGTTDIPNEEFMVHARRYPWDDWDEFLERSPIFYTPKARTPLLIMHGKNDTRVHPSQSMVLYRYLKTLGKVPVRLVFYPGEGHGNRRAAARYDFSRRMMRWMDHYLKGEGGEPPPYELDWPQMEER